MYSPVIRRNKATDVSCQKCVSNNSFAKPTRAQNKVRYSVAMSINESSVNETVNQLKIPWPTEILNINNKFVDDLSSFTTYDEKSAKFHPTICCVCDSLPKCPQWSCFVPIKEAVALFQKSGMESKRVEHLYPSVLLSQYSISQYPELQPFILSPASYINDKNEILFCNQCYSDLLRNKKKRKIGYPPEQAIANGYIIGEAPNVLSELNPVEMAIICRARIYCQSWVFFAGCHEHIKGWHTFFNNRPSHNIGNLMQLADAGMDKIILVVLCGPFTTTQKAITMKSTFVNPRKVIAAWHWLKANNIRYKDDVIPDVIPLPQIVYEDR